LNHPFVEGEASPEVSEKVIPTFKTSRDMHRRLDPTES